VTQHEVIGVERRQRAARGGRGCGIRRRLHGPSAAEASRGKRPRRSPLAWARPRPCHRHGAGRAAGPRPRANASGSLAAGANRADQRDRPGAADRGGARRARARPRRRASPTKACAGRARRAALHDPATGLLGRPPRPRNELRPANAAARARRHAHVEGTSVPGNAASAGPSPSAVSGFPGVLVPGDETPRREARLAVRDRGDAGR